MHDRNVVVKQMQSWIGCKESDGSHKKIIDIYNANTKGYKVKYTDAWCATTVSACAIAVGYTDIMPLECSCQRMIELYKKIGRWMENDAYVPKAGDVIFYDWDDNGVGDCTGHSEHVGIVELVNGNSIAVIEGNNNDAVRRRTIQVNGRYIRGYGLPAYDSESAHESKPDGYWVKVTAIELNIRSKPSTSAPVIGRFAKGDLVYITNRNNNWGYFELPNGVEGWISLSYTTPV